MGPHPRKGLRRAGTGERQQHRRADLPNTGRRGKHILVQQDHGDADR